MLVNFVKWIKKWYWDIWLNPYEDDKDIFLRDYSEDEFLAYREKVNMGLKKLEEEE